MLRRASN